ncbi:DUF3515 family protein [Kineococcus aurantiacus]|uniref:DUF3515 family protein n=1 Tax=Kineococcus aurantiacus TaxID=37633 RepID=A0A7Y9ASH1_9ACTN|nr:DUF3515 family protein [Kineococcus aurantiacus]NYD21168.1 hypothetical protein [Kineococcus aurantiacus]
MSPEPPEPPEPPGPTAPRRPVPRPLVGLVVVVVAAAAVWAYAVGSRGVEAAPGAGDPACAPLLDALPATLGGLARTPQGAAGVAAWGEDQVVLRCGALVLGPTTKACVPVGPDAGPSVDWVQDAAGERAVRFLTYGRTPAVEVTVRFGDGITRDQATSQLIDLAAPVSAIPQTRTCL